MTIKQTSDAVAVTGAGTFERIVSHDEALEAAKALIDGHFNNKGGRGVYISIPAQPDNTDVLLVDYIKQQRALSRLASTRPMTEDVAGLVEAVMGVVRTAYACGYTDRPGDRDFSDNEERLRTDLRAALTALSAKSEAGESEVERYRAALDEIANAFQVGSRALLIERAATALKGTPSDGK